MRVYSCAPCAAPAAPTGLAIDQPDPATITLEWNAAAGATQYEVWTAENTPYFDLTGKTCANPAPYTCSVVGGTTYSAADGGDPLVLHAYLVRGANSCGQTSAVSTRVAEFDYDLTPGD